VGSLGGKLGRMPREKKLTTLYEGMFPLRLSFAFISYQMVVSSLQLSISFFCSLLDFVLFFSFSSAPRESAGNKTIAKKMGNLLLKKRACLTW